MEKTTSSVRREYGSQLMELVETNKTQLNNYWKMFEGFAGSKLALIFWRVHMRELLRDQPVQLGKPVLLGTYLDSFEQQAQEEGDFDGGTESGGKEDLIKSLVETITNSLEIIEMRNNNNKRILGWVPTGLATEIWKRRARAWVAVGRLELWTT